MKAIVAVLSITMSAVLLRLVPHVPNFAPVGAMALFGGTYLGKKYSVIIVFMTLLLSDYLLLYIHPFSSELITFSRIYPLTVLVHSTTLYVYGSFLLNIGIGMWLKNHQSVENIILASIGSSILFFLITNFGVWVTGAYARNMSGLWESYIMGLPFFRATVFGDLFYNGLFFSAYAIIASVVESKKIAVKNYE
jgi:hypothetical protein